MPGITNRRQGELLRAAFRVLIKHPEGLPGREVLTQMAQSVQFNDYELGHYASSPDEPRALKATRFWTVNCVKAGWMTKSKGTWQLTCSSPTPDERRTPSSLTLVTLSASPPGSI
jgi:restriction system protein